MSQWFTIEAERVLRVSRGRDTILCDDHCPSALTIVVKLSDQNADELRASLSSHKRLEEK